MTDEKMNSETETADAPITAEAVESSAEEMPSAAEAGNDVATKPEEEGGPQGPEPTRFGDWERKGRCIDF